MPCVFSKLMLIEEARFASRAIQLIMSKNAFRNHKFMLMGHSMGGLVIYNTILNHGFPIEQLLTVITLGSPLSDGAHFFNEEIVSLQREMLAELEKSKLFEEHSKITHLNIYSGTRDILVADKISMNAFTPKANLVNTEHMRNLYLSLDHNSFLYYKPYLDAFIPGAFASFLETRDMSKYFGFQETFKEFDTSNLTEISHYHTLKSAERDIKLSDNDVKEIVVKIERSLETDKSGEISIFGAILKENTV